MSVTNIEDLTARIKQRFVNSDNPSDEDIAFLEDFTVTFNSFSASNSNELSDKVKDLEAKVADWEQKYNDNEANWKKKYIDRFEGKVTDIPEVKQTLDAERGSNITIEDLFTAK